MQQALAQRDMSDSCGEQRVVDLLAVPLETYDVVTVRISHYIHGSSKSALSGGNLLLPEPHGVVTLRTDCTDSACRLCYWSCPDTGLALHRLIVCLE